MVKEPFYSVIEKQISDAGMPASLISHFEDYNQALSTFFSICANAAVSALPYHAAHVIRDDGIMIEGRVFDRRVESSPESVIGE